MRKLKLLIVPFLLAVLLTSTMHISAQNIFEIKLTAQNILYNEAYVEVSLYSESDVAGIQGNLGFDGNLLEFASAEVNSSIAAYNGSSAVKQVDNTVRLLLMGDVDKGTSGHWITLRFKIKNNCIGQAEFSFENAVASDADGKKTEISSKAILIEVNGALIGDINNDGTVNIKDLVRFKKYFAENTEISREKSDINADGSINTDDIAELRKKLLMIV